MRFTVAGAGAIGGFVGACLSRGGADVTLIARGPHLEAIRAHGIRVSGRIGDFVAHPAATDDLNAVSDADVVFLGFKAYSLPEIAPTIGMALRPGAVVISAQNGIPWWYFEGDPGPHWGRTIDSVDPGGVVSASIDPRHVVGSILYCATEIIDPGVIRHVEGTRFSIGELDGSESERCAEIAAAFVAGGLRCPISSDLRAEIWLKLVGNAAFNPVSALTGATLGQIGDSPMASALCRELMEEAAAVASGLGVELPVAIDRRFSAAVGVGDHKTSMLQDREAGKPLEIGCMTGAIVELASLLGIEVPRMRAMHALLEAAEDVRMKRDR